MKTVDRILQIVKRDGSVTAKQLSSELGMTTMGARQHLQGLEDEGILSTHDVKVKVGRPTRHWALTQKGHEQFADRHGELTVQFIEAVEHIFGKEGLEKVTSEREKLTLQNYRQHLASCDSLESKLRKLVSLREQEGYMAELEQDEHGFILIENHCPICKAATHCPSLCQSELNVFQTLLGSETSIERTEHIISGQRRCIYRIQA
ncbi:metalloregulator ArsR/SmtB family transcription factor [Vibrio sp. B1FLJ16]|uniref:helix-turn-helix transcriptional regulator n=1 Tax=Vibrio sp. B1FLJ16 TaxID=2751178 RepID=UPI0015F3FB58|nr:metalloregulator ArsR/SmtB family transcription factor [Vibrio sp. B1FLJ16]CAD7797764.1 Transcriptional regulator [Vibrio sp. B1FLJ16]CAE6881822.1 Transcriptional regulator [Vibrio sp. B1FLJ16]